jgi:hypothetical protein
VTVVIGFAILAGILLLLVLSGLAMFRRPHPATALFTLFALALFAWQAVDGYRINQKQRRELAAISQAGNDSKHRELVAAEELSSTWWKIMAIAGLVPLAGFSAQVVKLSRAHRLNLR